MGPDVTTLKEAWSAGDRGALDRLIELTYPELHATALRYLKRERPGHTLQCTAPINITITVPDDHPSARRNRNSI